MRDDHALRPLVAPLELQTNGVMTTSELKAWAGIGDETLKKLEAGLGLRPMPSRGGAFRYPLVPVFRQVLGLDPGSPEDVRLLLKPLKTVSWVSRVTGHGVSTLGRHARGVAPIKGFPMPVQLSGGAADDGDPRGRRWLPAQIEAALCGEPDPFGHLRTEAPALAARPARPSARNVFEDIVAGSGARNGQVPP